MSEPETVIYECSCGAFHPWSFFDSGSCRDADTRYASVADYANRNGLTVGDIEVLSMDERADDEDEDEPEIDEPDDSFEEDEEDEDEGEFDDGGES